MTQTDFTLAERAEMAALGLSELIQADIQAADGKGNETQRKLILAQAVMLEAIAALGLELGPHCSDIMAGAGA